MARLDPKLIQQGEESNVKVVKHRGFTSFTNINPIVPTNDSNLEATAATHRHEFIVYEDDTVEILPNLVLPELEDSEISESELRSQIGGVSDNSKGTHTHEYIGFFPDGVIMETDINGISHTHKIIGAQEKIQLIQPMYKRTDIKSVINTRFTEFYQSSANSAMSIPKFFQHYQQLFYDIPKDGENSHTTLIAQSSGYLTNYVDPSEEEIRELTTRIVELEQEIAEKELADKEHPVFQNGSFLKHPDNPTVYYMDKGQKRAIDNMEVYNILKRVNGHSAEEPNEEVIILVTEDVIKGLETGPKFRSEDLYGDEEQRKQEEEKKLVKLDPDDFIADPNNYETVNDYLVALDRETRQLLAKEEYLQELFFRYKYDSENLTDSNAASDAKIESRTYGAQLTKVRQQILRYTAILESVDPDGDLQNVEIDISQLKKVVDTENARTTFTKDELAQLGPKQNTIQRFLDENKASGPLEVTKEQVNNSATNTGTGAGNNTSAYLAAAGLGGASGYAAEEQPKSPPNRFTPNPSGLVKNHTFQEAVNLMQLGKKSPQGNWYWTLKVNDKNKVVRARETGKWKLYENSLLNPLVTTPKPNSHWNWKRNDFEWAPMPGKFPGMKDRVWEGKVIHKLRPEVTTNEERRPIGGRSGTGLY